MYRLRFPYRGGERRVGRFRPCCPRCAAVIRPEVVLFGEMMPAGLMSRFIETLIRGFDMVFSIGTSSSFPLYRPAGGLGRPVRHPDGGNQSRPDGAEPPRRFSPAAGAAAAMTALLERLDQPSRAAA